MSMQYTIGQLPGAKDIIKEGQDTANGAGLILTSYKLEQRHHNLLKALAAFYGMSQAAILRAIIDEWSIEQKE